MRGRGWEGGVSKLFNREFNGKDEIYIKDMINTSIVCTKQRKKKAIHEQQKIKMQLITMLDYVYSSCHKKQIHLIVFFFWLIAKKKDNI